MVSSLSSNGGSERDTVELASKFYAQIQIHKFYFEASSCGDCYFGRIVLSAGNFLVCSGSGEEISEVSRTVNCANKTNFLSILSKYFHSTGELKGKTFALYPSSFGENE